MPEIALPGTASMVPVARHAVRELLAESPRLEDAELIVSEYVANAVLHTRSAYEGGRVRIVVETKPGWARLEVYDDGALPVRRTARGEGENGRGLLLVDGVAERWGQNSTPIGSCMWAELDWTEAQ